MTPASVHSLSMYFYRGFELCYGNGLPANSGVKGAIRNGVLKNGAREDFPLIFKLAYVRLDRIKGRKGSVTNDNYFHLSLTPLAEENASRPWVGVLVPISSRGQRGQIYLFHSSY